MNGQQQTAVGTTEPQQQSVSTSGSYSPQVQKEIQLGNREYALKNYEKAVEYYGQASELQYSLQFNFLTIAPKKQVLMILIFSSFTEKHSSKSRRRTVKSSVERRLRILHSVWLIFISLIIIDPKQALATAAGAGSVSESETKVNPKISFSGDAEDEEDEEGEEGEGDEEKEDDFQIAWEVLETAKLLYEKEIESRKGKGVSGRGSEVDNSLERKIADVCDLLGEVSIENGSTLFLENGLLLESFDAAVQDLTKALELKIGLYAPSDPIISEAHYKLSLALEFATHPSPEENRQKALEHLEAAIDSVKQRVVLLESQDNHEQAKYAKELIEELTVKVDEMRNPTKGEIDVGAMFGSGVGLSEVLQQKVAESLAGGAHDLTALVRKKEKKPGSEEASVGEKRRMEDSPEGQAEKKR